MTVPTIAGWQSGIRRLVIRCETIMNSKITFLLSGAIVILMVTCALPFATDEDSEALVGNSSGWSLNPNTAVLYSDTATSVTLEINSPDNIDTSNASWSLNDLDDGVSFVTLAVGANQCTVTAGTLPQGKTVATVEVVATVVSGGVVYTASSVIVVYPSASDPTDTFHFYFQVNAKALGLASDDLILPVGYTQEQFETGFWVTVTKNQVGSNVDFNALTALQWYLNEHNWSRSIGSSGWIDTLLGLGTYSGTDGSWIYWAQYHLVDGEWAFNNTTLGYISTVDEIYLGLIFWESPNSSTVPVPPSTIPM